jgi:hypothetical protein
LVKPLASCLLLSLLVAIWAHLKVGAVLGISFFIPRFFDSRYYEDKAR